MQIYGSKFSIYIALEFQDFFKMSKILKKLALKAPSKWPIGDIFKNPTQGIWSTLVHTCGLILD